MTQFQVRISARKQGAIGIPGEYRTYVVEADNRDQAAKAAIDKVYDEGGLECVFVRTISAL